MKTTIVTARSQASKQAKIRPNLITRNQVNGRSMKITVPLYDNIEIRKLSLEIANFYCAKKP